MPHPSHTSNAAPFPRFRGAPLDTARLLLPALLLLVSTPAVTLAQSGQVGREGPREVLPIQHEIALARSAAPASVSGEATIWTLTETGYEIAVDGTNGANCYVGRSWPDSIEPFCFDEEGSRTIFPIRRMRMEMIQRGESMEAVERAVADGLQSGRFTLPTRPAMGYMMSSGQDLISDEGNPAGNWEPHLMIYFPYLDASGMGLPEVYGGEGLLIVDPGTPLSNIMVIMEEFVDPEPTTDGGR